MKTFTIDVTRANDKKNLTVTQSQDNRPVITGSFVEIDSPGSRILGQSKETLNKMCYEKGFRVSLLLTEEQKTEILSKAGAIFEADTDVTHLRLKVSVSQINSPSQGVDPKTQNVTYTFVTSVKEVLEVTDEGEGRINTAMLDIMGNLSDCNNTASRMQYDAEKMEKKGQGSFKESVQKALSWL